MPPRVALRVAYDGTRFHGSQRQQGVRTVESELLDALIGLGAMTEDVAAARFRAASRTDSGVSAAANVFALDTEFPLAGLAGAVNARARDLWVTAVAPAPRGFRPRASPRRAYRYHQWAGAVPDVAAFTDVLTAFEGTHDFTSFARLVKGQTPMRHVESVTVREAADVITVDVTAPSFLWNQIRRMIGAGLAVARGDATRDAVARALADPGEHAADFGRAPAEPLVLVDVHHDLPWRTAGAGARRARDALARRAAAAAVAHAVAGTLAEAHDLRS